jgi:dipeptidase E
MRLLLISSSTVHGFDFLEQPRPWIREVVGDGGRIAFVPFAMTDAEGYTQRVAEALPFARVHAVRDAGDLAADAIFVGGGNTFRLLKTLYDRGLIEPLREAVRGGTAYIGSSAGTNIAAPTIRTTNDMPIVEPPTLASLGFVPYQINPHYLDADPSTTHMGETREERLMQYLEENETPVIGLREGSALEVLDGRTKLLGDRPARIFRRAEAAVEVQPGIIEI